MHSKGLGGGRKRKIFNIGDILCKFSCIRDVVDVARTEAVVCAEDGRSDISAHDGLDQPHILIVSDSSSIVYLCAQIVQHLVRHCLVLIKQHPQLPFANIQIFIGEFVGDVPPDWPEFAPILNNSMEEAEPK